MEIPGWDTQAVPLGRRLGDGFLGARTLGAVLEFVYGTFRLSGEPFMTRFLADAVTSIEYYLERLAEGIGENDSILRVAEDSLASLGFPVGAEPTWTETAAEDVPVVEPAEEQPETTVTAAPEETKSSDSELLDDEILGIFVEEAEEVLETIHEFYPRLRQNHDDREALTEVRRAFHTLKGSGRLVGATSIGELAWSVEKYNAYS